MAKSLNRCTFIGRLVRDPEPRFMQDGTTTSSFTIAVDDDKKDRNTGTSRDHAEFVPLSVIGRLAEICNQYLKKGKQIYAEGKFVTRKYTDRSGAEKYITEVQLENMQMLGSRDDSAGGSQQASAPPQQRQRPTPPAGGGAPPQMDDDIPFAQIARGKALLAI